jgi:hypothetical protein
LRVASQKKRNAGENRIKDERRDRESTIGGGRRAQEGVACLNQDQHGNEDDDADLSRDRAIAFHIEHRAEKKNRDLRSRLLLRRALRDVRAARN